MPGVNGSSVIQSSCFVLGVLGARLAANLDATAGSLGLTHKQLGLLAVVDAGLATSQKQTAITMNVAPSLVVSIADQLEARGLIRRERDADDRRIQRVSLTPDGRSMLAAGAAAAAELDAAFRATLSPAGSEALDVLLADLAHLVVHDQH